MVDPIDTSVDALLDGAVAYEQPVRGYRVSLEAPLLARFAIDHRARAFAHAIDLGAGAGAIGLMLLATGWAARATAIEADPLYAALARRNAAANHFRGRFDVVEEPVESFRRPDGDGGAELVIANPPYFDPRAGGVSPESRRARARALGGAPETSVDDLAVNRLAPLGGSFGIRSELRAENPSGTPITLGASPSALPPDPHPSATNQRQDFRRPALVLDDVRAQLARWTRTARRALGRSGRFVLAFPAANVAALFDALADAGLSPKRMRCVHPRPSREAQVVFVEAKAGRPGGLVVERPIVVRLVGEAYAPEVDDALRGRWPPGGAA